MLKKNKPQYDFFTMEVFNRLLPKDHQLVKIEEMINFEFIYDNFKDKYSARGRGSKDPIMMVKILLLEYLYGYSDVQMEKAIQTDIAFRWFLGLNLDEKGPDASTISYFRVKRTTEENLEDFFNEVIQIAITQGFVKNQRFIVDSTDVAANVNYPSSKKLLYSSLENVIKRIHKMDSLTALALSAECNTKFKQLKENREDEYSIQELATVIKEIAESIPGSNLSQYIVDEKFVKDYQTMFSLLKQTHENRGDKIVSVVDPDARVAHKTRGNLKKGYKNHIIIDEDSELILASIQTPFNVKDEKRLTHLIEKAEANHGLKPKELSADKAYGIYENRAYLAERNIQSHIAFYNLNNDKKYFGLEEFIVDEHLEYAICPAGHKTYEYIFRSKMDSEDAEIVFRFDKLTCKKCPLNSQCATRKKDSKSPGRRELRVDRRYDVVMKDLAHNETEDFKLAWNRRSIVERRFATLVRNFGLRRSRYVGMSATAKHIILSNTACNIRRLLKLFHQSRLHALSTT
jgi:transposase